MRQRRAAATILGYIYPALAQDFQAKAEEAVHSRVLAGVHCPSEVAAGLALGQQVAQQVIARAQVDDARLAYDGIIPIGPGRWIGEKPAEPNVAQWQPWVLATQDTVRPAPPLAHDSPVVAIELQAVQTFNRTFASNQKALWW